MSKFILEYDYVSRITYLTSTDNRNLCQLGTALRVLFVLEARRRHGRLRVGPPPHTHKDSQFCIVQARTGCGSSSDGFVRAPVLNPEHRPSRITIYVAEELAQHNAPNVLKPTM